MLRTPRPRLTVVLTVPLLFLLAAAAGGLAPRAASAAECAEGIPPKVCARLVRELRKRCGELRDLAERFGPSCCNKCWGKGRLERWHWGTREDGTRYRVSDGWYVCPTCAGVPYTLGQSEYASIFFHMQSPRYQRMFGHSEFPETERRGTQSGFSRPRILKLYKELGHMKRPRVLDLTHATVEVRWPHTGSVEVLRWVWYDPETYSGNPWYLYDERVDGPWPGEEEEREEEVEVERVDRTGAGLPQRIRAAKRVIRTARQAVSTLDLDFDLETVFDAGGWHVLQMIAKPGKTVPALTAKLTADSVRILRAVMSKTRAPSGHTIEWWTYMRDRLGQTHFKLRWSCWLTTGVFDEVVWENLLPAEQTTLLGWKTHDSEGWVPWTAPARVPRPRTTSGSSNGDDPEAWVPHGAYRFPPAGGYAHSVPIRAKRGRWSLHSVLSTEPFEVGSLDGQDDTPTPAVTLEISVPKAREEGQLPETVDLHFVTRCPGCTEGAALAEALKSGLTIEAPRKVHWESDRWEAVVSNGRLVVSTVKDRAGGLRVIAGYRPDLETALALAREPELRVRLGGRKGLAVVLDRQAVRVLRDVLSRLPPP